MHGVVSGGDVGILVVVSESVACDSGDAGIGVAGDVFTDEAIYGIVSFLAGDFAGIGAGIRVDCDCAATRGIVGCEGNYCVAAGSGRAVVGEWL